MLAWDSVVPLHRPVLIESIHYALTGFNISADVPLQLRLGKRPVKDLPFRLVWNDTDTVTIAKDQIARSDPHLVDCDRTAIIHYIVAALQTVGVTTVSEGGKVQGQYGVAIAKMRIEHDPRCP
jgi:hypothetical protein